MARIRRPDTSGGSNLRPIGEQGAAAAASGAAIGGAVSDAGRAISQSGLRYFEAATRSMQEAQYTNAMADTTEAFNKQYAERLQQRVDEDGNPNFTTLADDTAAMGKALRDETAAKIFDPAVKAKYMADFDKHIQNQQVLALGEARRQHMDYSRASMQKGIESFTQQALVGDPSQVSHHLERVEGIIEGNLQGGIISAQEAANLSKAARSNILVGSMQRTIEANPELAMQQLAEGPEALGLTVQEHVGLTKQAEAGQRDLERQAARQEAEELRIRNEQQNLNKGELELEIMQGIAGEKEVEAALERGDINPKQRLTLLKQLFRNEKKQNKEQVIGNSIDVSIANGAPIFEATPRQIGDHYQTRVAGISRPGDVGQPSQPPSLLEKAKIASDYVAPVKPFQKEVAFSLEHGTPQQAAEAMRAWEYATNKQPLSLEGLDRDAAAIAVAARNILTHTNSSDADAIRTAREQVLDKSDDTRRARTKKYNTIGDFKSEKLEETVADMFDADAFLGFGGANVDPGVLPVMDRLLKEAYVQTGNVEDAKELVKSQTAALYGESEFNKDQGLIDDTETFMFMPPEKVFPGVEFQDLRSDLEESIAPMIPAGYEAKDIRIQSDVLTRSNPRQPSWSLYVIGPQGQEIPVTNPKTGNVVRWAPDYNSIVGKRRTVKVEDARKEREDAVKNTKEMQELLRTSSTMSLRGGFQRAMFKPGEE